MTTAVPLEDVRLALSAAKARKALGTAQHAAFTRYPIGGTCCRDVDYGARPLKALHFGPMCRGDLDRLLERTHTAHGTRGVRLTWGAGPRALKTEFANWVMH